MLDKIRKLSKKDSFRIKCQDIGGCDRKAIYCEQRSSSGAMMFFYACAEHVTKERPGDAPKFVLGQGNRKLTGDAVARAFRERMQKTVEAQSLAAAEKLLANLPARIDKRRLDPAKIAAVIAEEFHILCQ